MKGFVLREDIWKTHILLRNNDNTGEYQCRVLGCR